MNFEYKVEKIIIYPVKSLGGIEVKQQKVLKSGLEWDRRWMLVDENGKFLTQRTNAKLALFKTSFENDFLCIQFEKKILEVDKFQQRGKKIKVTIWEHTVDAIEVSEQANKWFSARLEMNCRLVKMNAESNRIKNLKVEPNKTEVNFADAYPFLILGTKSMEKLNEKLESSISYNRFRPNILVQTAIENEEDNWNEFNIANCSFKTIKPCVRCKVITINQQTAVVTNEPTKTLATYRKVDNNIIFGSNVMCLQSGTIAIADKLSF